MNAHRPTDATCPLHLVVGPTPAHMEALNLLMDSKASVGKAKAWPRIHSWVDASTALLLVMNCVGIGVAVVQYFIRPAQGMDTVNSDALLRPDLRSRVFTGLRKHHRCV